MIKHLVQSSKNISLKLNSGPPRKSLRESLMQLRFIGRSQQHLSVKPPRPPKKTEPVMVKINPVHVEKHPSHIKSKPTPPLPTVQPKPVHVELKPSNLVTNSSRFPTPTTVSPIPRPVPNLIPAKFEVAQRFQQSPQSGFQSPVNTDAIYSNQNSGLRPVYPAAPSNPVVKAQENLITEMKKNFGSNSDLNLPNRSQLRR